MIESFPDITAISDAFRRLAIRRKILHLSRITRECVIARRERRKSMRAFGASADPRNHDRTFSDITTISNAFRRIAIRRKTTFICVLFACIIVRREFRKKYTGVRCDQLIREITIEFSDTPQY